VNPRNEAKIENKVIRRLVKVCSSEEKKMTLYDFKYFYSVLSTHNPIAKKNFMADLVFAKNIEISVEKYKRRVEMLFKNQADFLRSEEFFQAKAKTISKEYFLKKLKVYEKTLEKFHYFSNVERHSGVNFDIISLQGIRNCCKCIAHNSKENFYYSMNSHNKDVITFLTSLEI
jgi:hypothetical protein